MKPKFLILSLIAIVLFFAGCSHPQKPIKLTGETFELVSVGVQNKKYKKTILEFKNDGLQIFAITDLHKMAGDVTMTSYAVTANRLSFLSKSFEIKKTPGGYHLYSNGVLKYQLFSNPVF